VPVIQGVTPVFLYVQQLPVIAETSLCQLELAPDGRSDALMEQYDRRFGHGDDVAHGWNRANDRASIGRKCHAPSKWNKRPCPFMEIVQNDFGNYLSGGNGARGNYISCYKPTQCERIEAASDAPTDSLCD
jgi:hypothetical protein